MASDEVVVECVEAHPGFHMIHWTSELAAWEVIVEALYAVLEALDDPFHVGFEVVTVNLMPQTKAAACTGISRSPIRVDRVPPVLGFQLG